MYQIRIIPKSNILVNVCILESVNLNWAVEDLTRNIQFGKSRRPIHETRETKITISFPHICRQGRVKVIAEAGIWMTSLTSPSSSFSNSLNYAKKQYDFEIRNDFPESLGGVTNFPNLMWELSLSWARCCGGVGNLNKISFIVIVSHTARSIKQ